MSAGGTSWGAAGVGVVGVGPQLGDDVGSLLQDLVMCSDGAGIPGSAARVTRPSPRVLRCRRSRGIWTLLVGLSWLSTLAN
jgi:hypothetical protein